MGERVISTGSPAPHHPFSHKRLLPVAPGKAANDFSLSFFTFAGYMLHGPGKNFHLFTRTKLIMLGCLAQEILDSVHLPSGGQ